MTPLFARTPRILLLALVAVSMVLYASHELAFGPFGAAETGGIMAECLLWAWWARWLMVGPARCWA